MPGDEQLILLNKLGEIPVLNDSWVVATDCYSKVRDFNVLMRMTLSIAESSVKVAGQLSTPVLSRYQPQINNLNGFACKTLDNLETKYPIIKQPTEQWKETCADFAEPVMVRVKPVFSQVQGIVDNGNRKINGIRTASANMMEGAKNCGVSTVFHVVNTTIETAPGRFITRTVDSALGVADSLVDKYLPEVKNNEDGDMLGEDSGASSGCEVEIMDEMDPIPRRVLVHTGNVIDKIRERMYHRAMKDITHATARTSAALKRMTSTVELMDQAKKNLDTVKEKVDNVWSQIVKDTDATEEKTDFDGTVEEHIVALGRIVARQLRSGVTTFEKAYSELGEFSRNPISKTEEYKELMATFLSVQSIKSMSSSNLEKARESLKYLQDRVINMLNISPTLNWMAVDMEDIGINENDFGMEQIVTTNNNSEDELGREE